MKRACTSSTVRVLKFVEKKQRRRRRRRRRRNGGTL
jgi:hypothetical protein